jgi:hypothetical protein
MLLLEESANLYSLLTTITTLLVAPLVVVLATYLNSKLNKIHTLCNGNLSDANKKVERLLTLLRQHNINPDE